MEADALIAVSVEDSKKKEKFNFEKSYKIDEALRLTTDGRYQLKIFIIFGLSIYSSVMESTIMAYVLPIAQCDLNMSIKELGFTNSVVFMGHIITSYLWGFLSDTWGRRKVLLLAYTITFIFSLLSSLSISTLMMMITRFFVGVGISNIQASMTAYFGEFHCNENRAKWVSKINLFIASSFVIQPLLSLLFISIGINLSMFNGFFVVKPWRLLLLTTSTLPVICFAMIWNLPESPKFLLTQGKTMETMEILNDMYRVNHKKSVQNQYPVKHILPEYETRNSTTSANTFFQYMHLIWDQTKPLFFKPHLIDTAILCSVTFLIYMGGQGFFIWFPHLVSIYQRNKDSSVTICEAFAMSNVNVIPTNSTTMPLNSNSVNTTTAVPATLHAVTPLVVETVKVVCTAAVNSFTFQVTVVMATITLGVQGVIAYSIGKFGPKRVLISAFLAGACSLFLVTLTRDFYVNVFLIKFVSITTTGATILYTVASDLFPTQYKSMSISIVGLIGRIGAMFGSYFIGPLLVQHCGFTLPILGSVVICCTLAARSTLTRLENHYNKK